MKITTREMILVALFTALTAIGAFLSIPIGNVPITLQSIFTILAGLLLGPRLGALSQLIYVLLGLSGVRIFAGFSGGPQTIFSPSFGFLIGFIPAAFVIGKITHGEKNPSFVKIFIAALGGTLIIYLFGVPYMYMILNNVLNNPISFTTAIKSGCLIFLPGDLLKVIVSSLVAVKIINRIELANP